MVVLVAVEGSGPPPGRFRLRWPGMCACEMRHLYNVMYKCSRSLWCRTRVGNGG